MKAEWSEIRDLLVDPEDHSPLAEAARGVALVSETGRRFEFVDGQPVFLSPDGLELSGWRFPPIVVGDLQRPKPQRRGRRIAKLVKRVFEPAGSRRDAVNEFGELLASAGASPLLLVVGGATEGDALAALLRSDGVRVVAFDIYPTDETAFVADAHRIPLADESVDGVIVQAVLEHVYRPEVVVAEVERVVRAGGLVYAETPFMQPVHEGAYDFTRYTVSGHRLLFSGCDELRCGPIGGPGALINLACRGLVGGLIRSQAIAKAAYLLTLPLRSIDRLVDARWRRDYAIGGYFVGRRKPSNDPAPADPAQIFELDDRS
ncbi:MAG: methyltransferase domain-containing protein [Ilumatobacteraceae bacterium]|nr:methyltransferase domain-containing protein [Ilumatobacteraceae bacterium]